MKALLRVPRVWTGILIVAVVALVFHPVVFGDFSIASSAPARADGPGYHESGLPLHDPAAGANQDEGWLVFIRRSLASGHLPLVNLMNGMGAPVAESLQPGVFYLANPVLLLLDPTTPRFFDAFALLHVLLLVAGLYALLRLYAGRGASLTVAILVGLSGLTTQNVNMVHFRCHAWFPLVLYGAVRMARGDRGKWPFFAFVVAHAAQITCGAIQEAFVCSLVAGAVFCIEWWCAKEPAVSRPRRLARMALAIACSTAIGAVSVLPYLATRDTGDIVTASNPERSIGHATPVELSNFVVPQALGIFPSFAFTSEPPQRWLPDFSTLGTYLVLAGIAALLFARAPPPRGRVRWAAIALVVALGVAHLAGFPAFRVLRHVPFVCEILFVKYHNWIFTLSAVLAAAGIDALLDMDRGRARRIVLAALGAVLLLAWCLLSAAWARPLGEVVAALPPAPARDVAWSYGTSAFALLAGAALLFFRPRGARALLVVVAVVHALLVLPNGWFAREPMYKVPIEQIEVADPSLQDAGQLGLRPRVLSRYQSNQNLIFGFENLGVFDPVCNVRLRSLLRENFRVQHPEFDLQINSSEDERLTRAQLDILRFLGVTRLYGHEIDAAIQLPKTPGGGLRLEIALPRVWLLTKEEAEYLDHPLSVHSARPLLARAWNVVHPDADLIEVRDSAHGLDIRAKRDFTGELVVQQAYAHAWRFEGRSGRPMCAIFPRWSVDLRAGEMYRVRYVPLGFRLGAIISACGVVLALTSGLFLLRRL